MAKRGRKNAYETMIKPRFDDVSEWLRNGATERQIADNLGVGYSTFNKYKAEIKEFRELLKNGRKSLVLQLRGALVQRALGQTYTEKKKYKRKENGVVVEYEEETTRVALPDIAALNLCLKNYDADEWANDPQQLKLKRDELEFKKKQAENDGW